MQIVQAADWTALALVDTLVGVADTAHMTVVQQQSQYVQHDAQHVDVAELMAMLNEYKCYRSTLLQIQQNQAHASEGEIAQLEGLLQDYEQMFSFIDPADVYGMNFANNAIYEQANDSSSIALRGAQ